MLHRDLAAEHGRGGGGGDAMDRVTTMQGTVAPVDQPMVRLRPGQHVSVKIERLVFQGDGLGRLSDGRVIFVPSTAPGDEVEVRVEEDRSHFVRGVPVRVLVASSLRTDPPCRYFETCGGCQWQHVAYPAQPDWKRRILGGGPLVRVGNGWRCCRFRL
ncbi:MAG: TRAM domain-containing protein [Candidatus Moduliflexus flocculans]|nr:TRAM domain-containing protein [Candidatus Moduliflexus flocculans]